MRILIVDDSRAMRRIVARTLRQAGFSAHDLVEAGNGVDGLRAVTEHVPDLVLSDWHMPERNGIEMLEALRCRGDATPFAFVTSNPSPSMVGRAEAAGALCVIAKPFTAEELHEKLGPVLG